MIELYRYLRSDLYKLRGSLFFRVHVLFPLSGTALALLYAAFSAGSGRDKIAVFFQLFAAAYPFAASIACEIIAEQEERAGHYQNILALRSKAKAVLSKLLLLVAAGLAAVLWGLFLFALLLPATGTKLPLPVSSLILPALTLWGGNILLYALSVILAFQFGRTVCIGMGAVGSLLAALLPTGLGTGLWFVLPYGFGTCLSGLTYLSVMGEVSAVSAELGFGAGMCAGMTVLFTAVLFVWFPRYEGKYTNE